jgi:hypothetical protein
MFFEDTSNGFGGWIIHHAFEPHKTKNPGFFRDL